MVGDLTGEGHGTSKKSAKHQAAENVLAQLKSGVVPGEEKLPIKGDELENDQSMIHAGEINPIGTLQVRDEPPLLGMFLQESRRMFRNLLFPEVGAFRTIPWHLKQARATKKSSSSVVPSKNSKSMAAVVRKKLQSEM